MTGWFLILPALAGYPPPGRTERASVASDGNQGNSRSNWGSVNATGRWVAFESLARTLIPGDTNNATDVFLFDRETRTTERISVTDTGGQANNWSTGPASISDDGRYVAFESGARNLVDGITNGVGDIFIRDRVAGTTERVSVASDGTEAQGFSWGTSMSSDGRYVTFESVASNLVPGDTNGHWDVFVRDRVGGTTERVSVASDGSEGLGVSRFAEISADGRYVAFESSAPNLVIGDTNLGVDIFVHDRETKQTERVSVASDGSQANAESTTFGRSSIDISGDGRYVAFHSRASNLVPGDTNDELDVFVHDRQEGTTRRVSVASNGREANGWSAAPSISRDGRYVGFSSAAADLVPGDVNGYQDVFVHDLKTGATEMASVASDGRQGTNASRFAYISGNGRVVVFDGPAPDLVPGDSNGDYDVFARDRGPAVGPGEVSVVQQDDSLSVSGWSRLAGTEVAAVSDPADDALPPAGVLGAEITGAAVVFRSEEQDLFVRLDLRSLPAIAPGTCFNALGFGCYSGSAGSGAPAIVYGMSFDVEGIRYEVRALRLGSTPTSPTAPLFALYRCDPSCSESTTLSGGIGTAGTDVRVAIPFEALSLEPDAKLTSVTAFTGFGEAAPGELLRLDHADLPDAELPETEVSLGLAPEGTGQATVAFDTPASLTEGTFSGSLAIPPSASGVYDVWAKVCLGDTCGAASSPVDLDGGLPEPPAPEEWTQTFTTTGHITAFNPLSASGGGITESDFFSSDCEIPPESQGVDGYVTDIPGAYGTGSAKAVVRGITSLDAYDLDLAFYSDCEFVGQMATDSADEFSDVPDGTRFIVVNAFRGVATDFRLTLTMPPSPSSSPTATTSPSPTVSPSSSPTEDPGPEATEVSFTDNSATSAQYSDEAVFEARLTDSDGDPLAEQEVTFELAGADSSRTFTATTDHDGHARVTPTIDETPGPYQLTVRFAGDDDHAPSADTISFVVDKEDSELELTVAGKGSNRTLTARLSDQDTPSSGIAGATIDFYADGELIGSATTDADGVATLQAPPRYRGGKHDFEARFEGDDYYLTSTDREQT